MDDMTHEQRHRNMSHIRSTDGRAEILFRKALWRLGIRYRKNWKVLPGKPDIVISRYRIAVFVDGDFWHGKKFVPGSVGTHAEYWNKKILGNKERDQEVNDQLTEMGWLVLRFWESDIKKDLSHCVRQVLEYLPPEYIRRFNLAVKGED